MFVFSDGCDYQNDASCMHHSPLKELGELCHNPPNRVTLMCFDAHDKTDERACMRAAMFTGKRKCFSEAEAKEHVLVALPG